MRRRWGLARLGMLAVALAAMMGSVALGEEVTVNGYRVADSIAKAASEAFATPITANDVLSLPNADRLVNSMSGEMYADMLGTSINAQREFRRSLPSIYSYSQTAHYQNRADAGAASDGALANIAAENYYVYCPTTMCSPGSKWVMWDVPFFTKETQKRDDGHLGYEQNVSGFSTGISRMIGEASAIGLAVGYDYRKLKGRDNYLMENKGETLHVALYGGTNVGNWFIDGYAGFSRTWNRTFRRAEVSGSFGTADERYGKAHLQDNVYSAGLKASYVWILGNDMRITPSLGVDFSHVRMGGSKERASKNTPENGLMLLSMDKSNHTSVAMPFMVSANKTFSTGFLAFGGYNSLWTPEVRGGVVPQFGSRHASVDMGLNSPANGPTIPRYTAESSKFNRTYGTVGAGMKIKLRDKYIFNIDYDYSFTSKWNHHSVTAMYGVSF